MTLGDYGRRTTDHGRSGFSLIEVLVVIAIIAVLIGLMLPAIINFVKLPDHVAASNDISQLNLGVESFRNTYDVYPLSLLKLCGNEADYGNTPLDLRSKAFIRKMLGPRFAWTNQDWNGDGVADGTTILDGAQVLVFVLGGPGGQGFSADPSNPTASAGDRIPAFNFPASRLQASPDGFPRFTDRYGSPYLYFSAYDKPNGYQTGDCPQLPGGAYQIEPGKYANASTFQIIAAGPDRQFGAGSQLDSLPRPALDNQTNFHKGTLQSY